MKKTRHKATTVWREELATWLVLNQLTHKDAARVFAVGVSTVAAWVSGARAVPTRTMIMMRLYDRLLESDADVKGYAAILYQTI